MSPGATTEDSEARVTPLATASQATSVNLSGGFGKKVMMDRCDKKVLSVEYTHANVKWFDNHILFAELIVLYTFMYVVA